MRGDIDIYIPFLALAPNIATVQTYSSPDIDKNTYSSSVRCSGLALP